MGRGKAQTQRVTKVTLDISEEELLLALETLAKTLDVEVRYEKGDFVGGLCCVEGQNIVLIQKNETIGRKTKLLARELGVFNLDDIYVMPTLRTLIETELAEAKVRANQKDGIPMPAS
jgi:hypothetical protein